MKALLIVAAAVAAVFISGCAGDKDLLKAQADAAVANGNARVAEATAAAEEARAVIALSAKVDAGGASAYLVAKAMKGMGAPAAPQTVTVQQPRSILETAWSMALQVADVALRGYGIKSNRDVAIVQSNNQASTAIASYGAFTTMGQSIASAGTAGYPYVQAPGAITTTLSGAGVIGNGTYTGPVTTSRNCSGGTAAAGGGGGTGGGTTAGAQGGDAGAGGSAQGGTC